jgi:dienelactone hydrolase
VDSICLTGRHVTPFQAAIAFYPWCLPRMQQLNAPLLILIGEADN